LVRDVRSLDDAIATLLFAMEHGGEEMVKHARNLADAYIRTSNLPYDVDVLALLVRGIATPELCAAYGVDPEEPIPGYDSKDFCSRMAK
jgi:hypothetical protein